MIHSYKDCMMHPGIQEFLSTVNRFVLKSGFFLQDYPRQLQDLFPGGCVTGMKVLDVDVIRFNWLG